MPDIYVDADACPVKDEVLRVANRHDLTVHMVGNTWMRLNNEIGVNRVVVPEGPDAADDWIAEHIVANDIAITADIELASRCLSAGAHVLGPTGDPFTERNTCGKPAKSAAITAASPERTARTSSICWNARSNPQNERFKALYHA
jgi:uncharacterized protein YaiI (UPF0178 family)